MSICSSLTTMASMTPMSETRRVLPGVGQGRGACHSRAGTGRRDGSMTAAELADKLSHAGTVLLTGDALALALRLARDEVEREADVEALAEQVCGGAREEDDRGGY